MVAYDTAFNLLSITSGGVTAWILVHPLNTLCIQMNLATMSPGAKSLSFITYASDVIRNKGAMSLYNGLSAGILRQVFYATSRYGLFEKFRDESAKYRPVDLVSRVVCGSVAGGIAALISCPMEVTLVRFSNDATLPEDKRRNYKGVGNAFSRILKEEGAKTFFSGSGPFVNRAILVGAVQVGTFDQFRDYFRSTWGVTGQFANVFCASMASGILYSVATMPLETAKNRMAFQKPDPVTKELLYKSAIQTIRTIAAKEGFMTLFSGFFPYYLRCGGHTVTMFCSIEYIRAFYKSMK